MSMRDYATFHRRYGFFAADFANWLMKNNKEVFNILNDDPQSTWSEVTHKYIKEPKVVAALVRWKILGCPNIYE